MVTPLIVGRAETADIASVDGWQMIYGRRKVGKTHIVKNNLKYDLYVLVRRGGGALIDGGLPKRTDDHGQTMDMIVNALKDGKFVAVDEFQRLPSDFADRLQAVHPAGRLVLLGSSMKVANEYLSKNSPLLALLAETRLSLISPVDIFVALSGRIGAENALALSPYLRDPWTIRFLSDTPEDTILNILRHSRNAVSSLVGEIFLEEDRLLSEVYEGILRAIANGNNSVKEIADRLASMRLISSNNPSMIRQYILNMERMDLIQRIDWFDRSGYHYSLKSRAMEIQYYIEEKYDIESANLALAKEVISEKLPMHVQLFAGELMAQLSGGVSRAMLNPEGEVDIVITIRGKPMLMGEVKWSLKPKEADASRFLEKVKEFTCRKVMISRKPFRSRQLEVLTPDDLLVMAKAFTPP